MEKKLKRRIKERGITLIALVITIVILIILAVVAINAIFGDSGLLKYAEDAKNYQLNADASDAEMINDATSFIDEILSENGNNSGGDSDGVTTVADAKESGETFEQTTELEDDSGDSVWIPGGFHVTEDSATDADNGVVIEDENENEFVWVPVPDYTTMYTELPGTKLSGENVGVTTTTDVFSKLRLNSSDKNNFNSTIPGSSGEHDIREPDLVTDFDKEEIYYKNILNYNSPKDMADGLVAEYTATYNSIKKYKGFYIGRYELTGSVTNPTMQKGKVVLTDQNWYNLKKACSNIVSSEFAQSEMIYGNQWDEVMSWLKTTAFRDNPDKVDVNSSSWGNYSITSEGTGTKQVSGSNEAWKANNIYDLAGNCSEWTQEAGTTSLRISRGGYYEYSGSNGPVSDRLYYLSSLTNSNNSSRPALYIK